jgi:chemotaxis protein MotB
MMSLLLTFFVLLLSFSEVDAVRYRALSESLQEAFGIKKAQEIFNNPKSEALPAEGAGMSQGDLFEHLRSLIPQAYDGGRPSTSDGKGTLLTIPGRVLFESGEATLRDEMKPFLIEVAAILEKKPRMTLQVEGHTDDVPIHTARFPSNWELSAGRAIAVIRFLMEQAETPPDRLGAAGYADSRPLVANDSPKNRELNRRVEFRFVEPNGE